MSLKVYQPGICPHTVCLNATLSQVQLCLFARRPLSWHPDLVLMNEGVAFFFFLSKHSLNHHNYMSNPTITLTPSFLILTLTLKPSL